MPEFGRQLRRLRNLRGWSQMQLAAECEVSTRHLSFLETGRSRPSRGMVCRLGAALDLPFRLQNRLLLAAGFAPHFDDSDLSTPRLAAVREGLELLLARHDPYPAFVLDRRWNIVMSNRTHRRMLGHLQATTGMPAEEPENALRLVFAPDRLRPLVRNWPDVVRAIVLRLERQVRIAAGDDELEQLRDEALAYPGVGEVLEVAGTPGEELAILVPLELSFGDAVLRWYTTIANFGGAFGVSTQEAVIESLFPADEATKRLAWSLAETTD